MWPNPQFPGDLVTFTGKILNGKLHFFYSCNGQIMATFHNKFWAKRSVNQPWPKPTNDPIFYKPVNWFALQISELVSIWWRTLVVNKLIENSLFCVVRELLTTYKYPKSFRFHETYWTENVMIFHINQMCLFMHFHGFGSSFPRRYLFILPYKFGKF